MIPPYLHLGLGLVNDCVKEIQKSLSQLDGADPVAAAALLEKTGTLLELEVTISSTSSSWLTYSASPVWRFLRRC